MNAESGQLRRDLLLLIGLSLLLLAAGIGLRNPWPADEPVYALIARDMLAHHKWLIPMAGGDFYQDKPPLFFWLIAAGFRVTGSLKVGFLLPSMLAGLGTTLLVYDLGRRLWNREAGLYAALLLLFTVQFTLQSRRAQIDALLMFWIVLSLYCLLRQLLCGEGWRWCVAAGVAAGLGVLSKIVGFLSFMVLLPWFFAWWRGWKMPPAPRPWWLWSSGGVACVAVAALWIVPVLLAAQADPALVPYRDEVLLQQTFGRYTTPWHHVQPPWYYLQVIATAWMPLALLLPWLVPGWLRSLRERDARVLLILGWALLFVAFFSISSGKRDVYILPALPAVALASGYLLPGLLQRRGPQLALLLLTAFICLVCLGGAAWLSFGDTARGASLLQDAGLASFAPLVCIGAAGLVLLAVFRARRAAAALLGLFIVAWLTLGFWVFPQMDAQRSSSAFMTRLEQLADPERELGLLAYREQFLWSVRRTTVNFGHRRFRDEAQEIDDAARWLSVDPQRQLLVQDAMLEPCFHSAARRPAGRVSSIDWYLVTGRPDPACAARGDPRSALRYTPVMP
jgi:4-amino-4-deoxy-L-arabinose transferase-like glycosyltransferase